MEGIGDVIAAATKAIGIEPCESCEKRRDKWNKLFPFKKPHSLTPEEYAYLTEVFSWYNGLPLSGVQAVELLKCEEIWLRVFKVKTGGCKSCGSHYQNAYMNDLKRLYENSSDISK
jgi:hypothetical protein